jgi:hypothetical protein
MEITIDLASESARPTFIKKGPMIFETKEYADEALQAYDCLLAMVPKLKYVAKKDTDICMRMCASKTLGIIEGFRAVMQCCCDEGISMKEYFARYGSDSDCGACAFRSLVIETSKGLNKFLCRYTDMMTERASIKMISEEGMSDTDKMMANVVNSLHKKAGITHGTSDKPVQA